MDILGRLFREPPTFKKGLSSSLDIENNLFTLDIKKFELEVLYKKM